MQAINRKMICTLSKKFALNTQKLLLLFTLTFESYTFGFPASTLNKFVNNKCKIIEQIKGNNYCDDLRKHSLGDVAYTTFGAAWSLDRAYKTEKQKWNTILNDCCKVLAEKYTTPENLIQFHQQNNKCYYELDEQLNSLIAAQITITKGHLCQDWQTTLEIIKKHRSLFNFPSPLSILKFPQLMVSNQHYIVLSIPPHTIIKNEVSSAQSHSDTLAFKYDAPGNGNISIYKLPLQNNDNPLLTIKDKTRVSTLDTSPNNCFIRCENTDTLDHLFESNEWLSSLGSKEQKLMVELNSKLTLEEKLCLINAKSSTIMEQDKQTETIKEQSNTIKEQKIFIDSLGRKIVFIGLGALSIACIIAILQWYLVTP